MDTPLVSISVTTYQHAPFITACLEGILAQRRDFPVEILLGEDGSTDGTREIVMRFAEAHPDRIRLFLRDRSDVMVIDGRATGRANLLNNIRHARGRYLCHLDGDDRWTDPDRLRIMVELMELEPELGLCFHNAWNVYPDGHRIDYVRGRLGNTGMKERFTLEDLVTENFIPTSGVMWRFVPGMEIPREWLLASAADWVMNLYFAQKGPIGYIDRVMSDRNVHAGGVISATDPLHKMAVNLKLLALIDGMTHGAHAQRIERRRVTLRTDALKYAIDQGRSKEAIPIWRDLSRSSEYKGGFSERVRNTILTRAPGLGRFIHRLRS